MRQFLLTSAIVAAMALPVLAQDRAQTLADIRSELGSLSTQMTSLRQELATSGASGIVISGDVLQRVDAIEREMARLTSATEELQNRINRVVSDGTNRVGDLEFRLCELEDGCDIGSVGQATTLGGGAAPAAMPSGGLGTLQDTGQAELAVTEKADFERAQEALASGDFRAAADQFASFTQTYPGGPLSADAHFLRGEALGQLNDWNAAARAYLESFSGSPDATRAPEALYKLGLSLDRLGQRAEACLMLQEVSARYPASDQVSLASQSRAELNCS